jgi:Tol biopolymer transport system component
VNPKWIRLGAAAAALVLIGVVIAATAGGGDGGGPPAAGQETRTAPTRPPSEEGGHGEHFTDIYVLDMESRHLRRLTEYQLAQHPAWSPNGRIAFSSANDDESYARLFEVDARGINQVLIRAGVRHLFHPSWSPDGRSIAAVALGRGIYSISLKDHKTRKLTSSQSDEAPAWAPRGEWIAFDKRVGATNYDLFAVNAVTRKVRRLTRGPLQQTNPSWSPDGSRLVFAEQQRSGRWSIVTMRIDGSGRRKITDTHTSAQEPSWSPDGKSIAFIKQGLDRAFLAVIDADGNSKPRILTRKSLFASKPTWSPDGKHIAFSGTKASGNQ